LEPHGLSHVSADVVALPVPKCVSGRDIRELVWEVTV
jgi:hypothetical protein